MVTPYPVENLPAHIRLIQVPDDGATAIITEGTFEPSTYDPSPLINALLDQGRLMANTIPNADATIPCIGLPDGAIPLMKGIKAIRPDIDRYYTTARGIPGNTVNYLSTSAKSPEDPKEILATEMIALQAEAAGILVICDDHIKNGRQIKEMLKKFATGSYKILLLMNFVRGEALQLEAPAAEGVQEEIETLGKGAGLDKSNWLGLSNGKKTLQNRWLQAKQVA